MSKSIIFMPNKLERGVLNYFKSVVGESRGAAKKYASVFGQLYYWSTKMPDGFYKFKQPCKGNPLYREGDSWEESLDMTKAMFNPIFKKLVKQHVSKTAYRNATDKFEGKMFCSYMECGKTTNRTYYFMNKELVGEFISSLIDKISSFIPTIHSPKSTNGEVVSSPPESMNFDTLGVEENHPLLACARQTALNTQTIISNSHDAPKEPSVQTEEVKLISKEMVNTWNSHMNERVTLWPSIQRKLHETLRTYFEGSLEKWENYCETIASDNFLSGKSSNSYKLFLLQAIKPDFLEMKLEKKTVVKEMPSKKMLQEEINSSTEKQEVKDFRTLCLKHVGNAKYISNFKDISIEFRDDGEIALIAPYEYRANFLEQNCSSYLRSVLEELGEHITKITILAPGETRGRIIERKRNSHKQDEPTCNIDDQNEVKHAVNALEEHDPVLYKKPKNKNLEKYTDPNDYIFEKARFANFYLSELSNVSHGSYAI